MVFQLKLLNGQDHQAHIAVKQAFVQDPTKQQDQLLQPTIQALLANLKEHTILQYVEQMKGLMNQQQASSEVAQQEAAMKILQTNQLLVQQAQQQQGMDPVTLAAQADVMDAQTNAKKVDNDNKIKQLDTLLKAAKLDLDTTKEENRSMEARAELGLKDKQHGSKEHLDILDFVSSNLMEKDKKEDN